MDSMDFVVSAILGAREIISIVNTNTDQVTFVKHENPAVTLNQPVSLSACVRQWLGESWVHPDDLPLFDVLLYPEKLRSFCRKQKNGVLLTYRKQCLGGIRWARILLNVPEDFSDEKPEVLLCLRYLSDKEADEHDASRTVNATIRKAAKYDYHSDAFRNLKLPQGEETLRSRYRAEDSGGEGWTEEEAFVHPDDLEDFRSGTNRRNVLEWFLAGNSEKDVFYRRKIGVFYKWVKLIIHPASDYSPEKPTFLYYIVDVHKTMIALNSNPRREEWPQTAGDHAAERETFYDNLLNALSFFTQQYKDFYIVDLVRDRYIKYKIDRRVMDGVSPYIGCYSEAASRMLRQALPGDSGQNLQIFASLEELRLILEDKVSFEYSYTLPDGKRYRTICTRIESERGVPTKMIARTVLVTQENRLRVKTFGTFEVYDSQGRPVVFTRRKSKQLLAYLVDKYGFPVATADIVTDVLEKEPDDLNAVKYVSTLFRAAARDLAAAGCPDVICKEWNSLRVDVDKLDCDYYHLMEGDASYWADYHNEYMKEYSWAEETNAEIMRYGGI